LAPTRYILLLNGTEPVDDSDGGASGNYLTATGFDNVLTIEDVSGNVVKASFLKDLIVLQVAPRDGCFNKTFGLSGNNNGDKSDDLTVESTGEILPEDSSSSDIFEKFVRTQIISEESESLFPAEDFVPVSSDDAFTPIFSDQLDLSLCPAACNSNAACCLDASQGGEDLVEAFAVATKDIEETNLEAVGFFDNLRPAFEEAPGLFVFSGIDSQNITLKFVATDVDGISTLYCNICPDVDTYYADTHEVTCDVSGLGTNASVMAIKAKSLEYGSFSCFCEDSLGANSTSVTIVVKEDKTTSAEAWEEDVVVRPLSSPRSESPSDTREKKTKTRTTTMTTTIRGKASTSLAVLAAPTPSPLLWCYLLLLLTAVSFALAT